MTRLVAMLFLLCAPASATARTALLVWDYVEPKPDMVFQVWRSVDLNSWELHDLTTATNVPFLTTATSEFFKVRARDANTGWTSGCTASLVYPFTNTSRPALLVWDYVEPKPDMVFEVWRFAGPRKWDFYGLTMATNFPVPEQGGVFKVRARDVNTGWTSGCVVRIQYPPPAIQSVALGWDASPDSAITGYNIYYGPAAGIYTNRISVGNVVSATVSNLLGGANYYFVVKARNGAGLEAAPSNEVFWRPPL